MKLKDTILDLFSITSVWVTLLIVGAFLLFALSYLLEKRDCESYQEDDMTDYCLWLLD